MRTSAYGFWPSPLDAALAAADEGHPEYVGFVGGEAWWTGPRPAEGGRRTWRLSLYAQVFGLVPPGIATSEFVR